MNFFSKSSLEQSNNETSTNAWNPLQVIWDLRIGREEFIASPVFPVFISVSTYFIMCTLFMILDMVVKNTKYLRKYKLQSNEEVTWPMIARALRHTMMNNIFLILPATIAQCIWVPPTPLPKAAPGLFEFIWKTFAMLILFDFQYWIWHTVHHKIRWLYRNFHAIHHQYHSTFSWTTQYLHPWELFTVGFFSTVDGWFFECHPMTYWGFMLLNIIVSVEAHSGFDLPINTAKLIPFGIYGGTAKHDMHHMRPLTNFQPFFSTWDRLMGWECPGLKAGGHKSEELIKWEQQNKERRLNKMASQLMKGTENGLLFPKEITMSDTRLKYE